MRVGGTLVQSVPGRTLAASASAALLALSVLWLGSRAQSQADSVAAMAREPSKVIAEYQGLTVKEIQFRGFEGKNESDLLHLIAVRSGEPLERSKVRDSINALYATGRFADIQVEAQHDSGQTVSLIFIASANYFVGEVTVEGAEGRPSANQIVNISKLQLGELIGPDTMDQAMKRITTLLEENGYYRSRISHEEERDQKTQEVAIRLKLSLGERAHIGGVSVTGKPGYSDTEIRDIAGMHPGDTVTAERLKNALQRLRKKYQKKKRVLAQVTVEHNYRPERNSVDYTFDVDPGPVVEIAVTGFHLRNGLIKKYVPVYEENALDEDLLNEGRRNLLDYVQTRGYFEASVGIKRESRPSQDLLRVIYVIDPAARHRLVKVNFDIRTLSASGTRIFDAHDLQSRMQVQPAGRLLSQGRYSQSLLASDIRGLEQLYKAQGFAQVKIASEVVDDYEGVKDQLAVNLRVEEGPQTLVGVLHIVGNQAISEDQMRKVIETSEGQGFSDYLVSSDRDTVLNAYFNQGYPDATFEASAKPMEGEPNRMEVTFTIHEGVPLFVDQVLVSGLHYTRPSIVQGQLQVHPRDPLSQIDMLKTQKRLYDLGVFNQVDTAIQNPEGKEANKTILVNVQEAKRYTFNYGLGFEFQTGQPTTGVPTGRTGVSPRVSFDVTRLNFRGRDHTITLKSHAGRLQQRVLLSYSAPRWFNNPKLRLTFTTFYDNTLDVTTFTSKRLEGSVQAQQSLGRPASDDPEDIDKLPKLFYRLTYRRVQAANFAANFSPNQVPLLSQPTRVGMLGLSYIRNRRDNDLETTRGSYYTFDGDIASRAFSSEADFSRILFQNSTYYSIKKKFVFARSTRVGIETSFGNTYIISPAQATAQAQICSADPNSTVAQPPCSSVFIPLPERFYSGGGNSHRGFGLNQAGPRDPDSGFPVGGSGLILNSLELRFPPLPLPYVEDNMSFAIFHDAGNVFDTGHDMLHSLVRWRQKTPQLCRQDSTRTQCDFNYISHALGIGVRYKTPIGPVRFDFGYNLNPPAFPSCQTTASSGTATTSPFCPASSPYFVPKQATHFNVYFSIGQTF